jgi:5-(carboxyamino)imidazole ribonucleotide synthase
VTTVEFFLAGENRLLINEIAPRPHNSGHLTIEAAATSQFEQHIRAICGLPFGSTDLPRPAAMANLLGDLWYRGTPHWVAALAIPDVKLHLYGKHEARPGRKMGHLTVVARQAGGDVPGGVEYAVDTVTAARSALADGSPNGGERAGGSFAAVADIGA